MHCCKRLSSH